MKLKKFNEIHFQGGNYENGDPHSYSQVDDNKMKQYSKDDVINLIQDYYVTSLGNFDPNTDEERNFTNPNGRNYIDLDRIKGKIVDFMKDK
jgi:hypothetical protein